MKNNEYLINIKKYFDDNYLQYNETDISDERYSQEEPYSSDVSDNSTPINNALNNFENEEKEQSPTHSSSRSNSSKVEQVCICYLKWFSKK